MEQENKRTTTMYKGEISGNLLRSYITRIFDGIPYGLKANLGGETQLTVTLFGVSIKENEEKEKVLKYENKMKLSVFDCFDTVYNGADNRREFGTVVCDAKDFNYPLISYHRDVETNEWVNDMVKPYLRPFSSMTEEENEEYYNTMDKETQRNYPNSCDFSESIYYSKTIETFDWLNAHHFDYRGLIEMGLALEAPEGMYNN